MRRYIFITGLLVIFGCANLPAATEDGGYAGAFLKIAVAARPTGIGGAYIAVSDDGSGQLHNPAGVQTMTEEVFTSSYRAMKLGRKLGFLSAIFPTKRESVLGFSWVYVGYGEVDERDNNGYATGNVISSNEHTFAVSFAKRFTPFLGLGTKLNYYAKSHAELKSNTIGINVGAILYVDSLIGYGVMEDKLVTDVAAGVVINNIAAKYRWEMAGEGLAAARNDKFPTVVGGGLSCRALKRKLLLALDVEKNFEQNLLMRFGGEFTLKEKFLLRGGLNDGTLSAGAGFNFVLEKLILSLDYAFSDGRVGEGEDHIFTFDINF